MKILHIVSSVNPLLGGVSEAIRFIASGLARFGITSDVVCMDKHDDDFVSDKEFRVFAMGNGVTPWCYNKKLLPWILNNGAKYDAIIVHGLWQYQTYAVSEAKKNASLKNVKLFVMPHGMLDPWFQKSKGRRLKAIRNVIIWHLVEKKIIKIANSLLFTCETEKILARQNFEDYNPKNETVVGLGIAPPPLPNTETTTQLNIKLGLEAGESYLLFLGRIDVKKGVDLLIQAYINIAKNTSLRKKLVIAGPGIDSEFGQKIKQMCASSPDILFPGMLSGDLKWSAFYNCEAFILPSHQENFGISVVEALACGKPVLISNQVNIWKEIQVGGAGLVEQDTLQGVESLLSTWYLLGSADRKTMEQKAREVYQINYSIEQVSQRFKNILISEDYA
jgi:glycosyltransferase involved in cell wall biosynthesis